jgi:hypothetical protein
MERGFDAAEDQPWPGYAGPRRREMTPGMALEDVWI